MLTVALSIKGKTCLIVGGGSVAERRIQTLLREEPVIVVISPTLTKSLKGLMEDGKITWIPRCYTYGMLPKAMLAIIATDDEHVNYDCAREARAKGMLVNRADEHRDCDFTMPAEVQLGDLRASISTGQISPRLNRLLREDFVRRYGLVQDILPRIKILREAVRERLATSKEREAFWRKYLTAEELECMLNGHWSTIEERIKSAISSIGRKS